MPQGFRRSRRHALVCGTLLALAQGQASAQESPASGAASACDTTPGRVLEVGPGRAYALPSEAAARALPGNVIKIAAGDYSGDVVTWRASDLTICGDGGRARMLADGRAAQGKAIWVIAADNVTIENVEFSGAKVADRNGAGIRAEGGNLTVRHCAFFDNENGILGGGPGATITVEHSEFARNGFGDGQSHNIYIGRADRLVVNASWFHEARIGHQLKSRARENRIENSYFMDGPDGTSSYLIDLPEGGVALLRGNLLHKGPHADNPNAIAFGAEGLRWPINTLELVHNTVVITRSGGAFIAAAPATQSIRLMANLFAGTAKPALLAGGFNAADTVQTFNVVTSADLFPGADNLLAPAFWPGPALQARSALPEIAAAQYTHDAPRPLGLRKLAGSKRFAGALQSRP